MYLLDFHCFQPVRHSCKAIGYGMCCCLLESAFKTFFVASLLE